MLALAHSGITLGVAAILSSIQRSHPGSVVEVARRPGKRWLPHSLSSAMQRVSSPLLSLAERIDIRLLLIGALLPDIIDKPLGLLLFENGRVFAHTLLFWLLLTAGALYYYLGSRRSWLLVLSFGTFCHLVLDQMWLTPKTLLWPAFGFSFPREDAAGWLSSILQGLVTKPELYVTELVGGVILIWFAGILLGRKKTLQFIKTGKVW